MPDRDVFDQRAPKGWSKALRHLCGRSEPEIVAAASLRSLTKTIQTRGGIPGATAAMRLLEEFSTGEVSLGTVISRLRKEEHVVGDHSAAALGIRAAFHVLFRMEQEPGCFRNVPLALATQFCLTLVDSNLFGCAPELVGKRFPDITDLSDFRGQVIAELMPNIERIAQQLVVDTTGKTLKHPRSLFRRTRRKTGDILHESLT